jgi:hypothetical protein
MANHYNEDDLTGRLASPGWRLKPGKQDEAAVSGTLEHVVRATHDRRLKGETAGPIQEIETAVELDLIQIEKLWRYLGLPV